MSENREVMNSDQNQFYSVLSAQLSDSHVNSRTDPDMKSLSGHYNIHIIYTYKIN